MLTATIPMFSLRTRRSCACCALVFRQFKHFRHVQSQDQHIDILKQWILVGIVSSFCGLIPYGYETKATVLLAVALVPERVVKVLYEPVTDLSGVLLGPMRKHVEYLCIQFNTCAIRAVSLYLTPLWGKRGVVDVKTLDDEEYRRVLASFKQLSTEIFAEKRRRMKLFFTSTPQSSTCDRKALSSRDELKERNGVYRTPQGVKTGRKDRKKYRPRKWGTMLPRSLSSFVDSLSTSDPDDSTCKENEDVRRKCVASEPRKRDDGALGPSIWGISRTRGSRDAA